MSDYLTNLAARSLNRAPAVQPRLALVFEPPQANASEPSFQETSQETPPAATHAIDGATQTIDGATTRDATFPSTAPPHHPTFPSGAPPSPSPHESSSPDFPSHAFPSHAFPSRTTPPSVEDERHDAPGAKWSPTVSTRAPQTFQEEGLSSSAGQVGAEHNGAEHGGAQHNNAEHDSAQQGRSPSQSASLHPEPWPQSGLLIPPPSASRLAPPPSSLETGAPHASESHPSELQSSETQASEETQTPRSSSTPSIEETRGALAPQHPTATPSRSRLNPSRGRLNDEPVSSVTDSMRPATQRTPGALDSGAKGAYGQFVEQSVEDAAPRVVAERLGRQSGPPQRPLAGAEQSAEKVLQSLLVPASAGTSGQADASSSNVMRGTEHAATADAIRVRARVQTPAHASADARSKPDAAPTIHVSIGRIEVRAVTPPAPAQPRPAPARPAPKMSLDDYLRAHNGGRK